MSLKKVFHTAIRVSSWSHAVAIGFIALILSACTDYVDKYEGDYKDDYGDKEKFLEKMNTYDGSWAEVCASDEWVWCAATSEGKIMGKANNGESWTQFTDGSAKLNFTGKDENAYHFTTNLLPSDVSSIVRENGGIKIELVDGEGSDAGIQLQVGHLGSYSEISVLTVKTGGTKPFISLRNVNENGDVVSEWRFYLYTTEGESVQTVTFTEFTHVSGNSDLADFIKNEVNTVAIGNSTVNNSLRVVALKFGGVPFDVLSIIASSSSNKGETAKSCSSNNGGSTAKSSSSSANTVWSITCQGNTSNNKINWGPIYYFFSEADKQNAKYSWTLNGAKTTVSTDRTPVALYSENGTYTSELAVTLNGVTKTTKCSAEITGITATSSSTAKSSSSVTPDNPTATGFLWDGSKKSDFVKTDFGSGNKWFIFTDADTDSGSTYVSVPEINPYDVCLGKCIGVKFGEPVGNNERQPYAGVGFDLGESGAIYDVSGWQGICIAYQSIITSQSSAELRVDLRPYDPNYYGYNIPAHTLPVNVTGLGADYHIENILWSEFAQRWSGPEELSGEEVAAMLRGISITLESDPNTVAFFNVYQIGSYGQCGQVRATSVDMSLFPFPESSSSSSGENPGDNTSWCGDLWCGATDTQGKVNTGFDERAGYWFVFDDSRDKGNSNIFFPADVEENEYGNFFGPLIETYKGIIGEVHLGDGYDYPYVGFGFNVYDEYGTGTDISDWSGFCLVYRSTIGFSIEIVPENDSAVTGYNNYKATVPKSSTITAANFPWAKFKQGSGWGKTVDQSTVLADVSNIRLKFEGTAGTSGVAEIYSIGRPGTCSQPPDYSSSSSYIFASSSSSSEDEFGLEKIPISFDSVAGFAQVGPFSEASDVSLFEINDGRTLATTGKSFTTNTTNNRGRYKFPARDLVSQYAVISVNGKYRNIVTGNESSSGITLKVLTDLRKGSIVNINVLTYLEFERVYHLVTIGDQNGQKLTVTEAKRQAQREILELFHIELTHDIYAEYMDLFGSEDANAALIAVTLLLQGNRTETQLMSLLTEISNDLADDGVWDDSAKMAEIAQWAATQDLSQIRTRLESWGGTSVANFEALVDHFVMQNIPAWQYLNPEKNYGTFIDSRDGQVYKTIDVGNYTWFAQNLNLEYNDGEGNSCPGSDPDSCAKYGRMYTWAAAMDSVGIYSTKAQGCGRGVDCAIILPHRGICPEGWHIPSNAEWEILLDSAGGDTIAAPVLKSQMGWRSNGSNTSGTNDLGFSAIPSGPDEYGLFWSSTRNSNIYGYRLRLFSGADLKASIGDGAKDDAMAVRCVKETVPRPVSGMFIDDRDGQEYPYIRINTQTWMAKNLNFATDSSACFGNDTANCNMFGRLYIWEAAVAKSSEECGYDKNCNLPATGYIRGVCPEGWHLPRISELETLIDAAGGGGDAGRVLKSPDTWNYYDDDYTGTNETGFNALCAGTRNDNGVFMSDGMYTYYWSASETNSSRARYMQLYYYGKSAGTNSEYKDNYYSVRCVQDED